MIYSWDAKKKEFILVDDSNNKDFVIFKWNGIAFNDVNSNLKEKLPKEVYDNYMTICSQLEIESLNYPLKKKVFFRSQALSLYDGLQSWLDDIQKKFDEIHSLEEFTEEAKAKRREVLKQIAIEFINSNDNNASGLFEYMRNSFNTLKIVLNDRTTYVPKGMTLNAYESAMLTTIELIKNTKDILTVEDYKAMIKPYMSDKIAVKAFNSIFVTELGGMGLSERQLDKENDFFINLPVTTYMLDQLEYVVNLIPSIKQGIIQDISRSTVKFHLETSGLQLGILQHYIKCLPEYI